MTVEVLLETVGPNGNLQAVVQSEGDVCYFYLFGARETGFPTKSVWVRNYSVAPQSLDVEGMQNGRPPSLPAPNCRHPDGLAAPNPDNLRVVWLPEGNGAALYEENELLAVIPPWSGVGGFDGYARDCIGQSPVAWELTPENVLVQRFQDAQAHWDLWDDPDLWSSAEATLISQVEAHLGRHSNYYAINGGDWPPKSLIRIPLRDGVALVTIGVSMRPQPNVEMSTDSPEDLRRIELGVVLPASWPDAAIKRFGSYLSAQSNLPWTQYTWLGPGHTIPCDSWQHPRLTSAMLVYEHPGAPRLSLGPQFGDPVNVLWFLPVTEQELQAAVDKGSESVIQQLPQRRWRDA